MDNKLNEIKKTRVLVFIPSLGDNPQIFETIEGVNQGFPTTEKQIMIWHDCCSDDHSKKVEALCDIYIRTNHMFGGNKPLGFTSLYMDYDVLLAMCDDMVLPKGYEGGLDFFNGTRIGIVGEVAIRSDGLPVAEIGKYYYAEKDTLPDIPMMIKKEVIEIAGGMNPYFSNFGYHIYEFQDRVKKAGWEIVGINSGSKNLGKFATELVGKEFEKKEIYKSQKAWKPKKDWWT